MNVASSYDFLPVGVGVFNLQVSTSTTSVLGKRCGQGRKLVERFLGQPEENYFLTNGSSV